MASPIIGRTPCPECGFASSHVKQSEKCLFRYCPECGAQHHARTERQRANLLEKTRLDAAPVPTPTPTQEPAATPAAPAVALVPTPTPTGSEASPPVPTPAPTRRRSALFGF